MIYSGTLQQIQQATGKEHLTDMFLAMMKQTELEQGLDASDERRELETRLAMRVARCVHERLSV